MKAIEEELQMLRRENTSLKSLSQIPEASQDTMSDAQIRRPTPADPQVLSSLVGMPYSQGDLQVEDRLCMSPATLPHDNLSSPPPEPHCSTSYADNMQPHKEAESSSPTMAEEPLLVLERDP